MAGAIAVERLDALKADVRDVVRDAARHLPALRYADARVEVVESRSAAAEHGAVKSAADEYTAGLGVRVLAGERLVGPGYVGLTLGAGDLDDLPRVLRAALARAHRRAMVNGERKADARGKLGALGEALAETPLHPIDAREDTVPAVYRVDPRSVSLETLTAFTTDVARRVAAVDPGLAYTRVATLTQLSRELFASSQGSLIDQAFALTQGLCSVVAVDGPTSQRVWDVLGHQRGWEILEAGVDEALLAYPPFVEFAVALAREAVALAAAPPAPTSEREVVVVTDPHYNTLVSHEILGHPAELDRALKMETAYAGRSWLLRTPAAHQVGKPVASPLVSAYSDPALPGYGHYRYDDEGTPARRVVHIDRGVWRGFMNSRQTAALFGGAPNGHYKATGAPLVPLVRMSTTVFAAGERDPREIIREVDRGWYVAGHRTPSIAESRENFRISARRVYEIRNGELGRLHRDGGIAADSRDYLMNVDAVGSDFRLYPIANCGKGQPMQSRKLGNGGPTMRSRARILGG